MKVKGAGMKKIEDYGFNQRLTFLYIAFAYQTDFDLAEKEHDLIVQKIRGWYPEEDSDNFISEFEEAETWYRDVFDHYTEELMPMIVSIAKHIGNTFDNNDQKKKIIDELTEIAKADKGMNQREKDWLAGLAKDMGIET